MNTSYGYNRNDHSWVDAREIVIRLVDIVSKGSNCLLNVGPTDEGLIPQPSVDRLMEVGEWMDTNQTAIYGTNVWKVHGEGPISDGGTATPDGTPGAEHAAIDIRFTAKGNSVFAICLAWPDKDVLVRALSSQEIPSKEIRAVRMLGSREEIKWRQTGAGLLLSVPREKPCRHAFAYRIDLE